VGPKCPRREWGRTEPKQMGINENKIHGGKEQKGKEKSIRNLNREEFSKQRAKEKAGGGNHTEGPTGSRKNIIGGGGTHRVFPYPWEGELKKEANKGKGWRIFRDAG